MRYIDAELVYAAVLAFEAEPCAITDRQHAALKALENATVYEIVPPTSPALMGPNGETGI